MYKELVAKYKKAAKLKYRQLKKERRGRLKLPLREQYMRLREDRIRRLAWKKRVNAVKDPLEKKAQKKGYKYYRKLQHRKYKVTIFVLIVAGLGWLLGSWYMTATKPLTSEQQAKRTESLKLAEKVMGDGAVLLKNENSTLPLNNLKVNIFGASSASPILGGGGAGGISTASSVDLYGGLQSKGIKYNQELYNLYSNYVKSKKVDTAEYKKPGKTILDVLLPNAAGFLVKSPEELNPADIPSDVLKSAIKYSDTAIYTISRAGTETVDFKPDELKPTNQERATLDLLSKNFKHVILLVNTTNVMELNFTDIYPNVDSVLWIGGPGEIGMNSVAAILKGDINPSGRLTDTYTYNIKDNPTINNTGNFEYKTGIKDTKRYFVNYPEGIYVGYRYFETFLTGDDYDKTVQYPFGYGLSYTKFDWKLGHTETSKGKITAEISVTNSGERAGKDVVQLYYKAPYATGDVEKSAIDLGTYAKTKELQPGESETIKLTLNERDMASYDDTRAKAWVLDSGDYTIQVSRNVHAPEFSFNYNVPEKQIYRTDSTTNTKVTNKFDAARGDLEYLSRDADNKKALDAPAESSYNTTDKVLAGDYTHKKSNGETPNTKVDNGLKLSDLKGLDYDNPRWQKFVEQLSTDELIKLAGHGGYWSVAIPRLGVPKTSMYDGPASIRNFLTAWASVAYPIPAVLASSWDQNLAQEVGKIMGEEAQTFGVDAAYAPSLNMHRSPLGGRNFEYLSEDPIVTGLTGAAYIKGLQSTGTIAVMKHFVANDQETNRANYGLYTWLNEQSLREIYLKPFELAVKQGKAHGVMSAFNRIGATWAGGDKALLTDVLRKEWGFEGFVITDAGIAGQGAHFNALQAIEAGNDMMLSSVFEWMKNDFESELAKDLKDDPAGTTTALQNAAHNILYYVTLTNKI